MRSHSLSRLKWKDVIKMRLTVVACDDGKLSFMINAVINDRTCSTCNKRYDAEMY